MDVTSEESVQHAYTESVLHFGGIDILVANAGIASSSPFEDTSVKNWEQNFDVLTKGYFLASRGAYRLMQQQGAGSIVFVGSKNAVAAASGASAYASAKAAELHLARCLALEGAPYGIRVNSVNPDAVLSGSKIWDSDWRAARARDNGIDESELADHYRKRSLLKKEVLPVDVAEAVYFFASDASAKSTGNFINVDAGNAGAFPR
jgi:NAD(P)-dependent dehydrogenase (short-subunit alcohol dehydrogenase family)